jgi:hypothetical protein
MRVFSTGVILIAGMLGVAGCGGDDNGGETETRELISIANEKTEFFTGDSFGDRLGFQEELEEDGENVGTVFVACTLYPAKGGQHASCNLNVEIDGEGSLAAQGVVSFAEQGGQTVAITGGSGDFTGAGGTATVEVTEAATAPLTLNIVK